MNCESELAKNWRHINENGESLPTFWERRISKTYSKLLKNLFFYYKNTKTNGTQWDEPNNTNFYLSVHSHSPTSINTPDATATPALTPAPAPNTPDQTPDKTPDKTPAKTPDKTPGSNTPDQTPDLTPTPNSDIRETPTPDLTPTPTPGTPKPKHIETYHKQSFGLMDTTSFIEFLQKKRIEYNKEEKHWFDSNEKLKLNSDELLYLNLFKYKSRVHDLLDIDKTDIVSSLLTHLKTEPENIIELIENRITPKKGKEYIECLDVRNLKLEDIFQHTTFE
jgi:hypothetical protein